MVAYAIYLLFVWFQPHEVPEAYKTKVRPDRQVLHSSALTKKKKKMNLKSKDPKVQQQEEELYQKLEAKKVSMPHKVNVSKKKVSCSV